MPQKTNLNINPYFDDFNVDKNFYKVLFKPGYPVQSRELTTLQSILQHQIESFGSHIFKEGSMVIPGSITYDSKYYAVKIEPEHLGLDVSLYLQELVGKRIEGQNSGVVASIKNYSIPPDNNVEDITLYVKYSFSGNDFESVSFEDGETLILLDTLVYGNTSINSGDTVASLISTDSTATGSAVGLGAGVYFIRGTFVDVKDSLVILEPYSNTPSYRVGLTIFEEIVSSDSDESLNDNARGFSNYAAPGADRFRIRTILSKKNIDDFDDKNFVELIRIENGEIKKLQDKSTYSIIKDYFAKRTFEESGDYTLKNFEVSALNSLNDRISNEGIYLPNQKTEQGNTPSEDLLCYKISPGTAYVRGYDFNFPTSSIIDVEKPRDTQQVDTALVPFEMGNLLKINNVSGTPFIGINTNGNTVKLFNQRKSSVGSGVTYIGDARVYSFNLSDALYTNQTTSWDLYLFDIQTFTVLNLNETLDGNKCPKSSFIRGLSSGASGYVVSEPSSKSLTLTQTSGTFIVGEQILINESEENSRSIVFLRQYSTEDIKSVYQDSVGITASLKTAFSADASLSRKIASGFNVTDRITVNSAGIVTCPGKNFLGIKTDSIIRYQKSGISTTVDTFNKVISISADGFTMNVEAIPSVNGICDGSLPSPGSSETTTFSLAIPEFKNSDKASLYTELNAKNISNVNFSDSNLLVTAQISEVSTNSIGEAVVTVSNTGISSAFFESFDAERYSIFYSDKTIENLSSDQFELNSNGTQITFTGLKPNQTSNVTINTTLRKQTLKNKNKVLVRSKKIVVDKTRVGVSTAISGLTTSQFYGLRVEDNHISLNVPDVVNIVAIYESLDQTDPTLDKLNFVSGLSLNTDAIVGERILGSSTGAVAQVVNLPSSGSEVEFVYLNSQRFQVGETVTFEETNITSNIQSITNGNYLNKTSEFILDKGQKDQFYDYSKIIRVNGTTPPSRRLLVIFDYYTVPINDDGDLFTVDSYQKERFEKDIPILTSNIRASDVLDFRPRVSEFNPNLTLSSPFDYETRTFMSSSFEVVTPNESSLLGYSYYLPRIDRIVLNKLGQFSVIKGISSLQPKVSLNVEEAMDIATISLPAYLYDPQDATIISVDNRRYTMRDIGSLENRIENLEITTSLSLLESNVKTLQVQDSDGLSRFKTGFFVDDFKNNSLINKTNSDVKCDVNIDEQKLIPSNDFWSLKSELALAPSIDTTTADFSSDLTLLDTNVRKTGDLITLNYVEKSWLEQPFATQVENVNPFSIIEYTGGIILNPSSDNWVRNIYIENKRTVSDGSIGNAGESYDFVESIQVSSEPDPFMRSRNVEFRSGSLRPLTRHYSFIDDVSSIDIIPKLLEISMVSGSFNVGEDVEGYIGSEKVISFRTAKPSHKTGSYLNPTTEFNQNPYNRGQSFPSTYSASSTILNIDTTSLAEESLTRYGGYVQVGVKLIGTSSGAIATITDLRLISDSFGDLFGCFFIRDPNSSPVPLVRIRSGERIFKLNQNAENVNPLPGDKSSISLAETTYSGSGIIQTQVSNIVQVRNPPPPPPGGGGGGGKDPLAQSFTVDETGAFLTSVDVYFAEKDPDERLFVELRTVELGTPTDVIVADYARVALEPSQINVSNDASIATNIKFPSPIYLQPNVEYALVFLAPTSDKYKMWIAEMGQKTVNTANLPSPESVVFTKQYGGGSLFKSQNGTIWTANQYQDMKFKLYKANFTSRTGDAVFYNPPLIPDSSAIPYLQNNAITTYPRKLKVGITTTTNMNSILTLGKKVSYGSISSPGSYGFVEKTGGSIVSVSIANTGIGYSGGTSGGTYTNVPLYTISGNGSGATATVTITSSGFVNTVSIANTGNGYSVGDILGITTSSVIKGRDAKISVSSINGIDTLYLTNVQGEAFTAGQPLVYYDGLTAVATASTTVRGASSEINALYSGNVVGIRQFNHGMHSDSNFVEIKNISPDTVPVQLTGDVSINDVNISIANTSLFDQFEGITTSRGYVKVNNEIMYYTSISPGTAGGGTLGISTRGVDGTLISNHLSGDICYKYELNGISLTRINTTHNLPSNSYLKSLRDLDIYHLQINRGSRATGNSQLSFTDERNVGGNRIFASQNYQFNGIEPHFNIITPGRNTTVSAQIRTVSGTSSGGTEVSFLDQGYQNIQLNKMNFLSSPRIICSQKNETERLTSLPKNKSFTTRITMNSDDSNLSPVIDTQNAFYILTRSRVNNPISDYITDGRSNLITGDPHSSVYISNRIDIQQPATSIKVLLSAYRPPSSDFRVLYQLFRPDSSEIDQSFILFPGYDNLIDTDGDGFGDRVIDPNKNSGRPDAFVRTSKENEFLEYQYTADNLDQFSGFAIKIVMSSTNEANSPEFKDLRVIALA